MSNCMYSGDMRDAPDPTDAILGALDRLRPRRPRGPRSVHGDHGEHPHLARHSGMSPNGPARMRLLLALAAASDAQSVSDLGEAIGVDQPRASRLVQTAVELGLARRDADPQDARRTLIALTDDGRREAQGFRAHRRERVDQALEDFSETERADLARLLTKLADAWPDRDGGATDSG